MSAQLIPVPRELLERLRELLESEVAETQDRVAFLRDECQTHNATTDEYLEQCCADLRAVELLLSQDAAGRVVEPKLSAGWVPTYDDPDNRHGLPPAEPL